MGKIKTVFRILFKKKKQIVRPKKRERYLSLLRSIDKSVNLDEVVYLFPATLTPNNVKQKQLVVLFEKKLVIYRENQEKTEYSLSNIKEFRSVQKFGCVSLECNINGDDIILCNSDMKQQSEFSVAAKQFYRHLQNKQITADSSSENVCPKCGTPFDNRSKVCYNCLDIFGMFKRLMKIASPYKWKIFFALFLFFAVTALSLLTPQLNKILVDKYIGAKDPSSVKLGGFALVILSMFIVHLITTGLTMLRGISLTQVAEKVIVALRKLTFDKIELMSLSKIQKRTAGELMKRVTEDTRTLQQFVTNSFADVFAQLLIFVAITIMLFTYDWLLATIILLPVPFVIMAYRGFHKFIHKVYHKQWTYNANANTILYDIFGGIRVVKSFGMEKNEEKRYDDTINAERKAAIKNDCMFSVISPSLKFLLTVGEFALLFYVGNKVLDGDMSLGEIAMFSSYVGMLYAPLNSFSHLPRMLVRVFTSLVKIFDVIDEENDVVEKENAITPEIRGTIEFQNVYFGYDDSKDVLKDISFTAKKGEMIGIVGKSGVGKSTLINLVMRLYDIQDGKILIDGVDIKDISQYALRENIGVVLQETFLFGGTVYDNIAYAKANASRDEVIRAAKTAGAHKFIMKLPDGYNTYIGDKGHTLSGGERQRIAIARALLHDPKILILDEATSALDTETEKQLQDSLQQLMENRTTLAIAHRLSTLRNATRLIVLDEGKIAEIGTHEELLKKGGIYYSLVMAQRKMSKMAK